MGQIKLRPATEADLRRFKEGGALQFTARVWAGEDVESGEVLGIGGVYSTGWRGYLFFRMAEEARAYPVAMHKAALHTIEQAINDGHEELWCVLDQREPTARGWVERLGFSFSHYDPDGSEIWKRRL